MREHYDVVIVGGGLAGASCVEAIRDAGSEQSIALFSSESHPPYHRPPLTKGFVRGEKTEEDTLVEPEPWYERHAVDLFTSMPVRRIDRPDSNVELADGTTVGYGALVLATGAEPRVPDWPGTGDRTDRIFTIRTLEDSEHVRDHLEPGTRWLVVGGGYIGVETAASALQRGCQVDLVMQEPVLWTQFYGDRVGGWFHSQLREHGARIHPGDEVVRLDVDPDSDAVHVTTKAGLEFSVDYVLAGIGVTPRLDLARDAGLDTARGVTCDRFLRTSDPTIYAVGDICEYDSVVHDAPMRIEHWHVAKSQGAYVGRRIAGVTAATQPYDEVPYFFSELGDWAFMRYVGPGMGDVVVRGNMEDGEFSAAYVKDGRLVALLAVDHDEDLEDARRLLPDHPKMDTARLADASVSLADAVLA